MSTSQRRSHRRGPDRCDAGFAASRYRYRTQAHADARAQGFVVTGWLLDTNMLSELRRPRPERKVLAFVAAQPLALLYVNVGRFAEIRFGIERVADAGRRAELNDWLAPKWRPLFRHRGVRVSAKSLFK